jgi:hypothetical protein
MRDGAAIDPPCVIPMLTEIDELARSAIESTRRIVNGGPDLFAVLHGKGFRHIEPLVQGHHARDLA